MAKKPITKQQKVIFIILGVVVLYLIYSKVWLPFTQNIKQIEKELNDVEKKLKEVNDFILRRKEFEVKKMWYEDMLNEMRKCLPHSVEIPVVLRKITELASRTNVNIVSISPSGAVESEYLKELLYTVHIEGTYHTLAMFLTEVGNSDRIINVYDLQISPSGAISEGKVISSSFMFKIYVFKEI
jgi:type IV pilus assembly protein PilO